MNKNTEIVEAPIDKVIAKLKEGTSKVFESENYKELLRVSAKFADYSLNNCILISMQCPHATYVAGYKAWQTKFSRTVNKGEKAIRILAPSPYKVEVEEKRIDSESGKYVLDKDGNPIKDKVVKTIPAYRVAYVFDVSQTSGKPLPTITSKLTDDVEKYESYKIALENISPCPVKYRNIDGSANGFYDLKNREIIIREGMSESHTLKTLIHEITHAELHDRENGIDKDVPRSTAEVEAESVAFIVCEHMGIDSSQYSFGYIAGWAKHRELTELKDHLKVIHDTSSSIINSLDNELGIKHTELFVQDKKAVLKM